MLRGLVEARSAAGKGGKGDTPVDGPKRVVMVWAARHKAEFTILDEHVLAAARLEPLFSVACLEVSATWVNCPDPVGALHVLLCCPLRGATDDQPVPILCI